MTDSFDIAQRILIVICVCLLAGCATQKVVEVGAYEGRLKDFPYPNSRFADQIPEKLRLGTADLFEVIEWSKGLIDDNWFDGSRYTWPLAPVTSFFDLTEDGLSEVLVEIPWASGATGNRAAAVFLASQDGYKYVGIISRIALHACYPEQQACYLMSFGNSGQELGIALLEIGADSIDRIAACRTNKFDHESNNEILAFPEDHEELLRNIGLGKTGEAGALPGCAAAE